MKKILKIRKKEFNKKIYNGNYPRKNRYNLNKIDPPIFILNDFFISDRKLSENEIKTIREIKNRYKLDIRVNNFKPVITFRQLTFFECVINIFNEFFKRISRKKAEK